MTLSQHDANGEICQRTYVTCLTCGEELAYNWDKMRIEGRLTQEVPLRVPALAPVTRNTAWPILQAVAANNTGLLGSWQGKAKS
jgi:hypothetical protein